MKKTLFPKIIVSLALAAATVIGSAAVSFAAGNENPDPAKTATLVFTGVDNCGDSSPAELLTYNAEVGDIVEIVVGIQPTEESVKDLESIDLQIAIDQPDAESSITRADKPGAEKLCNVCGFYYNYYDGDVYCLTPKDSEVTRGVFTPTPKYDEYYENRRSIRYNFAQVLNDANIEGGIELLRFTVKITSPGTAYINGTLFDAYTTYAYTDNPTHAYTKVNDKITFSFEAKTVAKGEPAGSDRLLGDVNGDGTIMVDDATLVQKHAAGLVTLTGDDFKVADTNGDGQVLVDDATLIQKYAAGLITEFPAEKTA